MCEKCVVNRDIIIFQSVTCMWKKSLSFPKLEEKKLALKVGLCWHNFSRLTPLCLNFFFNYIKSILQCFVFFFFSSWCWISGVLHNVVNCKLVTYSMTRLRLSPIPQTKHKSLTKKKSSSSAVCAKRLHL